MIINKKYANYKRLKGYLYMFIKNGRKKVLIILASVIIIALVIWKYGSNITNVGQIQTFIESFGELGAVIFVILFNLKTLLVVFPYSVFVFLGGTLFGSFYGILLSILCVATSSTLAFWISRLLGKEKMKKLLKGRFSMLDEKAAESGFNIMLFMRLSCLFPADALSYAAGLTQMKYRHFIFGTVIGFIPEVVSITLLGHNIKNPLSKEFLMSVGLIVVTASISLIVQKIINISKKQGT